MGSCASTPAGHDLLPKQVRSEMQVLSGAQVNRVLDETRDDPHHALWAVLLTGGLRPRRRSGSSGPISTSTRASCGSPGSCAARRTAARGCSRSCKTDKSRRTVPLIPAAVEALRRHRDRQEAERFIAGERLRRPRVRIRRSPRASRCERTGVQVPLAPDAEAAEACRRCGSTMPAQSRRR